MSRAVCVASWADVPHLTPEATAELLAAIPLHERDARSKGTPRMGSGLIYPVDEDEITCDPFEFPGWYRHVYALDVGWNRTAALWAAIDYESDVAYLYSEHYRAQAEPPVHASAIKARGDWIPGVIDPAARGRGQKDGEQLFGMYVAEGLVLTPANNAVESGLMEVWKRLSTGRLKVFRNILPNFMNEYRVYRRDEKGAIVKANDHLMDCLRYLVATGLPMAALRPQRLWTAPGLMSQSGRTKPPEDYDPYKAAFQVGRTNKR